ncbi:hypothetical protein Slin14017_G062210 [Septoria linicola]|nr:hypothetical protein Slin14017_G062210 [Septoria linicola]
MVYFVVAHNALITHAILRHIYRLPLDYITIGTGQNYDVAHTSLVNLVTLRDAAMMFGLPELVREAEHNYIVKSLNAPALLADLGAQVFGRTDSLSMRSAIVAASAAHMQEILADENAWFDLYNNEAFSRAVLRLAYPTGHESSPQGEHMNQ